MPNRRHRRPDPKACAWAVFAISLTAGASAAEEKARRFSPDQLFTSEKSLVDQSFRVRVARCFLEAPPSYEPTCEVKTPGGNSIVIQGHSLSIDTPQDVQVEAAMKRYCLGDSRLASPRCEFEVTATARTVDPVRLVETGSGRVAVRLVRAGKLTLRR